jgi:hypothetical protein
MWLVWQIWNVAEAFRDTATSRAGIMSSTQLSGSTGIGGTTAPPPAGVEICPLRDLAVRLSYLLLREKARKAVAEMEMFERYHSSSGRHASLPAGLVPNDSTHSHTHSSSPFFSTSSDKSEKLSAGIAEGRAAPATSTGSPHRAPRTPQLPSKPHVYHIMLVILDAPSITASDKERDRPVSGGKASATLAAKEKIQVEKRVTAFAVSMWGNVSVHVTQSQRMRGYHTGLQTHPEAAIVIACELPFHLMRDLGSIVMRISSASLPLSQAHSNSITPPSTLISSFYSSPAALPFKRLLKAAVTELSHVSTSYSHSHSHSSQAIKNPLSGTAATSASHTLLTAQSPTLSAAIAPPKSAFLYSITDDKFDFISYSPSALARSN